MRTKTIKTTGKKTNLEDQIRTAKAYGIDITTLMANLKRTPYERIIRHQIALDTFLMLRKAKRLPRVLTIDNLIKFKTGNKSFQR